MTFADFYGGERLFLDANPMVYHFVAHPVLGPACTQLLRRIENRELTAYTSTHVLSEVAHHLMTLEASARFGWTSKVVHHLKQQPTSVMQLSAFRQAVDKIPLLNIQVLAVAPDLIAMAAAFSQQYGVLSNDALIVAVMQANGFAYLASNDADFDRVPGVTRYAPA